MQPLGQSLQLRSCTAHVSVHGRPAQPAALLALAWPLRLSACAGMLETLAASRAPSSSSTSTPAAACRRPCPGCWASLKTCSTSSGRTTTGARMLHEPGLIEPAPALGPSKRPPILADELCMLVMPQARWESPPVYVLAGASQLRKRESMNASSDRSNPDPVNNHLLGEYCGRGGVAGPAPADGQVEDDVEVAVEGRALVVVGILVWVGAVVAARLQRGTLSDTRPCHSCSAGSTVPTLHAVPKCTGAALGKVQSQRSRGPPRPGCAVDRRRTLPQLPSGEPEQAQGVVTYGTPSTAKLMDSKPQSTE